MGKEEITQKCTSPTGGFGRSSNSKKTNKQKKVPQRGLGVAQLEKIRLEEQQKKAASVLTSPTPPASNSLPSPTKSSPCVPNPAPIRHYQPPSSIPFPSLPSLDLPSPNSIFRPPNADVVRKPNSISTVPLPNKGTHGFEIPGHGNVVVPNLWNPNCEYNSADLNKESSSGILDPGFAFRRSLNNLPTFDNSNAIWALPNFPQRTHQFHHQPPPPPPPPSLVNVSSATSLLSSSSVLNFHTEPPSNQSYHSNYTTPMWSEEERMVAMKRPYPFSHDNEAPSINFKFPTFAPPPMRTDETTSCGNRGGTFNLDPDGNTIFREGSTCSTSISESNSKISIKENGSVNGDFLTLAPPTTNRTCPSPKFNFPPAYLAFHNPEVPDFASFPYKGSSEDTILQSGPSGSTPQQAFYTFIPPAKSQIVKPAATINNCNGEVGETVDLNLKL
ncbi:actin-binding protein wsp1-like [Rosa rugosa]|uniref:actin-binding protein wsp1-like n=1 Tax=Rosa rugosa TaxID=74645 RepID=UPI002B404033|nr:actin-binding protein wsp1-like [Rosa rugosa]